MSSRRSNAGINRRYSPYTSRANSQRLARRNETELDETEELVAHNGETKSEEPEPTTVMIEDFDNSRGAIVEEDAVALRDIGSHVRSQDFSSNAEIMNATPLITMDIQAIDVVDVFSGPMNGRDLRNTMAGMAVMINRLIFENRYLVRELQAMKTTGGGGGLTRFDSLVFKKTNILNSHVFNGGDGIPAVCLNNLVELFDQNCSRRNESAVSTLRRFVKYLLENTIPKELHSKFTVRERGGYERLTELPMSLTTMIKDVCLESVGLADPRTDDDRERREELGEAIFRFMKFSLQELRRTPRKAKVAVGKK